MDKHRTFSYNMYRGSVGGSADLQANVQGVLLDG